jgi:pimeloyl-ACP methyl ester carboxylesterase
MKEKVEMNNQNHSAEVGTRRYRARGYLRWFIGILALVLGLMLIGAIYESAAETADAQAFPPPGQMVDIGGYRLHINCTGSGSPIVVIDAGWGDASAGWGWVQPEVAKTTRICTYDRAGMGWSNVSSQPRTAREFAKELHTLLAKANEPGPYVLVGHSLGGYTVRVYAHDYPEEVAGLVLIDPQNLSTSGVATPQPAPKPGRTSLPALIARAGLVRLLSGLDQDLPPQDQHAYKALSVTPRWIQTALDEARGMTEGGAQARAVTTLGDLPLIVLSRFKDLDADTAASHARYLQLSSNSQQLFADQSGHAIQIEQPDAAVAAIIQMARQVHVSATR